MWPSRINFQQQQQQQQQSASNAMNSKNNSQDFVPLESPTQQPQQHQQRQPGNNSYYNPSKRKNENRASTYGMNYNYEALVGVFGDCPWRISGKHYSKGVIGLHEEIEDFFTYMCPTSEEHNLRLKVVSNIERVISDLWPDSQVEIFGSFRTGLYLPTSDIDLVVIGKWTNLPLHTLERALIDQNLVEPSSVKVLDRVSVPLLVGDCRRIVPLNTKTADKLSPLSSRLH